MKTTIILPTIHALKRAQSRGITPQMILDTIHFGQLIRKQGLRFYVMLKKNIPIESNKQYLDKLMNVTVVLSEDDQLITVYRNSVSIKKIKRKSKRLL